MSPNPDTEEKLAAAKEDLLKGRIATVAAAAAAREHGVTEKQLRDRLKGIGPLSSKPVNGKNRRCSESIFLNFLYQFD